MEYSINEEVLVKAEGVFKNAIILERNSRGNYRIRYVMSGKENWVRAQFVFPCVKQKQGGLLDIAISFLRNQKRPMSAGELIRIIIDNGLWEPTRAGKTPRHTLYGMLYNEAFYSTAPRIRKMDGGLWATITLK